MRLTPFDRIWKVFNINRISRMRTHYDAIKSSITPKTQKEQKEYMFFTESFEEHYTQTRIWLHARHVLYALLYASLLSNLFPYFTQLAGYIEIVRGFVGSTVILGLVVIATMRINLNVELLNEALTHLIVLYHHNPKRNVEQTLVHIQKTL